MNLILLIIIKIKILIICISTLFFFTGGCDSVIKLWNYNNSLDEINLLCNLENHSDWVTSLLYIKKYNYLISASNDS